MAGFVPREKLSKKARKEMDRSRRVTWGFSPVTKTVESKKTYSRKRKAHDRCGDDVMGPFFISFSAPGRFSRVRIHAAARFPGGNVPI